MVVATPVATDLPNLCIDNSLANLVKSHGIDALVQSRIIFLYFPVLNDVIKTRYLKLKFNAKTLTIRGNQYRYRTSDALDRVESVP